eukprot:353536-Chlamydomonas_euryale.AAC.8
MRTLCYLLITHVPTAVLLLRRHQVIAPHAADIDRNNAFPEAVDLWAEMGAFGLLGVTAPTEYGGLGLGYAEHCIAMEVCTARGWDRYVPGWWLFWSAQGGEIVAQVVAQIVAHLPVMQEEAKGL